MVPYIALGLARDLKSFAIKQETKLDHPVFTILSLVEDHSDPAKSEMIRRFSKRGFSIDNYHPLIKFIAKGSPQNKNILVNLDGVDLAQFRSFLENPSGPHHTNREFRMLLRSRYMFEHTRWFREDRELTFDELHELFGREFPDLFK